MVLNIIKYKMLIEYNKAIFENIMKIKKNTSVYSI